MDLGARAMEMMWLGALAAPPLAVLVGAVCLVGRCRPATRHSMWAAALASFIIPAIAGIVWRANWFQTSRLAPATIVTSTVEPAGETTSETSVVPPSPVRSNPISPSLEALADADPAPAATTTGANPIAAEASTTPTHGPSLDSNLERPSVEPSRDEATSPTLSKSDESIGASVPSSRETETSASLNERRDLSFAESSDAIPTAFLSGPEADDAALPAMCMDEPPATEFSDPPPDAARSVLNDTIVEPVDAADVAASSPVSRSPSIEAPRAPIAPAPSPVTVDDPSSASVARPQVWSAWLAQLLVVRDAISGMPPIPAVIWWSGAGLLTLVMSLRSLALYRVVRRGVPASIGVRRMVEEAAEEIGLPRVPTTVMVSERVSPMIWCGARPRLVLPVDLWGDLDDRSRRAVIFHELAHLKRRDHWVCWLETVVRILYWWHPIAWWVCRRVRDEADASCDVWVTSLMPKCRRAYAEALLATKSYLNVPGRRVPVGLGVMSNRTKRLARRLTMVMTQKSRPKTSAVGTFLAMGVIAAGMFVMPGLACPPDEHANSKAATKVQVAGKVSTARSSKNMLAPSKVDPSSPVGVTSIAGEPAVTFFGEAPALEAMRRSESGDDEAGLRRLEERLRKLEEQLRRLESKQGSRSGTPAAAPHATSPGPLHTPGPGAHTIAVAPGGMHLDHKALEETIARATEQARDAVARTAPARVYAETIRADAVRSAERAAADHARAAETYARTAEKTLRYGAAGGQNDPFAIVAEGPTHTEDYKLPEGKLRAMIALMEREDVPVFIERHSDKIVVHGTDSQHRVFRAFIKLINPEAGKATGGGSSSDDRMNTPQAAGRAAQEVRAADAKARTEQLRQQKKDIERRAKDMQKQSDKVRSKAEKLRSQIENTEERADKWRDKVEEASDDASRESTKKQLAEIEAQVAAMNADAEAMDAQADDLERQAEAIEESAEQLEAALEAAEEAMEDIDDANDEVSVILAPVPTALLTPSPLLSVTTMPVVPVAPVAISPLPPMAAMPALPPTPGSAPEAPAAPADPAAPAAGSAPLPPTPPAAPAAPAAPGSPSSPVAPSPASAPTSPVAPAAGAAPTPTPSTR